MFKRLKKMKKGEKKMDENYTGHVNYENNNNTVDQIFRDFDDAYNALKKTISVEFDDMEDMLARERRQANIYKNKVQVRDVMDEILPILTDIQNDVMDSTDLDELKKTIKNQYKRLFIAFSKAGVKIQMHERNQTIELEEKIDGSSSSSKPTTDPTLHQKVAYSNRMGCIIKGEEDNPILEVVEIYVFKKDETPDQPYNTDKYVNETKEQTYTSCSKDGEYSHQYNELKPQHEDCKTNADQKGTKIDAVICNQGKYVKFNAPVKLIKQSSASFSIISQEASIAVNQWTKVNIPQVYIDHENCSIYFGSQLLSMEFSLQNVDLYYRVFHDKDKSSLCLEFSNNTTKKVFVQHQLTFMTR